MILPTRKLLLMLLIPAAIMLIWRGPGGVTFGLALDAALLLLALLDWRYSPGPAALQVDRAVPTFLSLNADNRVGWDLRNRSNRTIRFALTDDLPDALEPDRRVVRGQILSRAGAHLRYSVRPRVRGKHTLGDVHLRCTTQLGLLVIQRRIARRTEVKVYPNAENLRRYELALQRHRLEQLGLRSTAERGKGVQFENLREYLPGDDVGDIAWKATARRNKLIVREFGVERNQNILVMLDCGRLMTTQTDGVSRLDRAINATILLTYAAMKQGDSIGLVAFSDQIESYMPPTRGYGALRRMNEALYRLEPRLREADFDRACRFLSLRHRKRSLIVIFTDVIDRTASAALLAHTARFARHHRPLCVTLRNRELQQLAGQRPESTSDLYVKTIALQAEQRREQALQRMRRDRVDVLDVDPLGLTPAVLSRYLEIKRRGAI